MQTIYIDVYFLINLTVDILAAHFSARILHINSSVFRLMTIGILGALLAVAEVLICPTFFCRILFLLCMLSISGYIICCGASVIRRIKFISAFLLFEMFIGGGVYYGYLLLDKYFSKYLIDNVGGVERREIIILSTLILFVIGVLKLLIMLFGMERHIKSVRVRIEVSDKSIEVDALVDSGNLVRDPMSMNPVLFVKRAVASKLLPINIVELTNIDELDGRLRKRIRLIPVTKHGKTHVMTGVRTDRVLILGDNGEDEVKVTLAIDKEEGSYGGYEALLPIAAVEDGK